MKIEIDQDLCDYITVTNLKEDLRIQNDIIEAYTDDPYHEDCLIAKQLRTAIMEVLDYYGWVRDE